MMRIIIREEVILIGFFEFNFKVKYDFSGPYISCHILSLFWNKTIAGDISFFEIIDK